MGIQVFQKFIETHCPTACVPVDLLKIARSVGVSRRSRANGNGRPSNNNNSGRLCLVVDGECCLDRLYGGYFSDWVCGGQWNRMVQFLAVLIQTIQNNNIELAVFFNGSLESQRMQEWIRVQQDERKKISQVLKHVEIKGTPPPKVWWIPPVCLTTCLRMALRHLNITVVCTMDDHHQEVIAYCRENSFHGLMAEDAEYAIFDPPRYFSSEQLKLTYKGSLETKEFILDEVAKRLDLNPNRFCVFAALLGNYLLTEVELADFYNTLNIDNKGKAPNDSLIKAVCDFVRTLPDIDNLDAIAIQIFNPNSSANGPGATKASTLVQKFKECVQYYLNGTKDGFLRYRTPTIGHKPEPGHYVPAWSGGPTPTHPLAGTDTAKFASETQESELSSLSAYQQATAGFNSGTPQIVIDPPNQAQIELSATHNANKSIENENIENETAGDSSLPTNSVPGTTTNTGGGNGTPNNSGSNNRQKNKAPTVSGGYPYQPQPTVHLPVVPPEVMRTASERHQKGLMSPWIYQVLTQGEIKIPACLEEEVPAELPSSALLYRPIRQMVYAILYNLHHLQFQARQKQEQNSEPSAGEEKVSDIFVKEWVWSKYNQYQYPDLVKAESLGWPVPTVQRLWFGSAMEEKKRRLRAFLTCMRSDTLLMLNTIYVPQHLLVMCCVLRYILSQSDYRILRRQELNAFLAQAVSPRLMDAQVMQGMQLPVISVRGVQLSSLFMKGVECALFANDACGAPIPWLMCCPWLFFDGKLFHYKLLKSDDAKNLLDLCDGQTDQVLKVERMRQAILKGLKVDFARPPLPSSAQHRIHGFPPPPPPPSHYLPAGAGPWAGVGRGRGSVAAGRRSILARGGQLEIAGVVVGSWGPNYGTGLCNRSGSGGGGNMHMAPQVTSIGGPRKPKPPYVPRYGGAPPGGFPAVGIGRGYPTYSVRRTPTRVRRPVGTQIQNNRKVKKGRGAGGGASSSNAVGGNKGNNQKVATVPGNTHSNQVPAGRGGPAQSGEKMVPPSEQVDNKSTSKSSPPEDVDQFEDATGEPKAIKTSPTIMKKPALSQGAPNGDSVDIESPDSGVNVSEVE